MSMGLFLELQYMGLLCSPKGPKYLTIRYLPRTPKVPLLRVTWSLLDGIWGLLKGSWGVLVGNPY